MGKEVNLEALKQRLNVDDFLHVGPLEFSRIQQAITEGALEPHELKILADVIPNLVQLQKGHIETLKEVISSAKDTQKTALEGISQSLKSLDKLLDFFSTAEQSDEIKGKIIDATIKLTEINVEIAKLIEKSNSDNNSFWRYVTGAAATAFVVVGGVLFSRRK